MQLVIVQIADQNDNGPHFAKKLYTGGKLGLFSASGFPCSFFYILAFSYIFLMLYFLHVLGVSEDAKHGSNIIQVSVSIQIVLVTKTY